MAMSRNQLAAYFREQRVPTAAERAMKYLLDEMGEWYDEQRLFSWPPQLGGEDGLTKCFILVDFYLPARRLIVEIDCPYSAELQVAQDEARDEFFRTRKRQNVLRVTNDDVLFQGKQVQTAILAYAVVKRRMEPPTSEPRDGGIH